MPVEVGQRLSAGDAIAVLEAMKMEHQVRADATGVVSSVAVEAGDQLDMGQLLVVITPDESA